MTSTVESMHIYIYIFFFVVLFERSEHGIMSKTTINQLLMHNGSVFKLCEWHSPLWDKEQNNEPFFQECLYFITFGSAYTSILDTSLMYACTALLKTNHVKRGKKVIRDFVLKSIFKNIGVTCVICINNTA